MKTYIAEIVVKIKQQGEEVLSRVADILALIGKSMIAAFTLVSSISAVALQQFRKHELSVNQLNSTLISHGIYTKELSTNYQKLSEQLALQSTFSESEILSAQANLQTYLGNLTVTKELIRSVLDFASAKKLDLESAASLIGKTIGSSVNALARHGIAIDETLGSAQKMAQVIDLLQSRFHGQAEAATLGLGSLNQFNKSALKLFELFGKTLAPLVVLVAQEMSKLAKFLAQDKTLISLFTAGLNSIAKVIVVLKDVIKARMEILLNTILSGSTAVNLLLRGQFEQAWEKLEESSEKNVTILLDQYKASQESLAQLETTKYRNEAAAQQKQLDILNARTKSRLNTIQSSISNREQFFKTYDQKELDRLYQKERLRNDNHLKTLTFKIEHEKDATKRLELELEKKKYLNEDLEKVDRKRSIILADLYKRQAQDQHDSLLNLLNNYQQMQNSKHSELIAIGKAAAITAMTIHGIKAVTWSFKWLMAIPVVGPIVAPVIASLVGLWYLEQISNIADVSLTNPGKISSGLSLPKIGELLKVVITNVPVAVSILSTDIAKAASQYAENMIKDPRFGSRDPEGDTQDLQRAIAAKTFFDQLASVASLVGGLFGKIFGIGGDDFGNVDAVRDAYAPYQGMSMGQLDYNVLRIGGRSPNEQRDRVIPLHNVATRLAIEVNVQGGLASDEASAKQIADQIYREIQRSAQLNG